MTIKQAKSHHRYLVPARNKLYADRNEQVDPLEEVVERIKSLDREIGHFAQAYNPRIAEKAVAWLVAA